MECKNILTLQFPDKKLLDETGQKCLTCQDLAKEVRDYAVTMATSIVMDTQLTYQNSGEELMNSNGKVQHLSIKVNPFFKISNKS